MNFGPPQWVVSAAEKALNDVPVNHYAHPKGRMRLRQALSKFYEPLFKRSLDVETEILISSGANEGIVYPPLEISFMYFRGQDSMLYLRHFWKMATRSSCSNHSSISIFPL
jgi:aspartate/methionine/tyrosine aminotransferase